MSVQLESDEVQPRLPKISWITRNNPKKGHEAFQQKWKAIAELEDAMVVNEEARKVSAAKRVREPVTTKAPCLVAQDHVSEDKID